MNRIAQQVAGILATSDTPFEASESGDTLFIALDSAVLQVDGVDGDHPRVEILAWLLTHIELDSAKELAILERLNEMNGRWVYPRFCLVKDLDAITMEYEFPAGDMQPDDFREVIAHLASLGEDADDDLQADFGGVRTMEHTLRDAAAMAARDAESDERTEPAEAASRLKKIFGR